MSYKRISPAPITEGGTGAQSFTTNGVIYGNGTSALGATAAGTTGQVLTGVTSSAPVWGSPPVSFTWAVTTIDASMVAGNGYVANKAGLLTMTLPASSAIGDILEITGMNTALGWKIAQNANQIIHFGTSNTTTGVGGSLASSQIRDSVRMVCVVSGSSAEWNILSSIGNITVV